MAQSKDKRFQIDFEPVEKRIEITGEDFVALCFSIGWRSRPFHVLS